MADRGDLKLPRQALDIGSICLPRFIAGAARYRGEDIGISFESGHQLLLLDTPQLGDLIPVAGRGLEFEPRGRLLGIFPRRPHVRYFTLERAEGESRTALCEWASGQSDHVPLGDGPSPSEQAFREAIEERLAVS